MKWFTKPLAEPTTHVPASVSDELQSIEDQYLRAEKEFVEAGRAVLEFQREHREAGSVLLVGNRAYCRVNALSLTNPESARLFTLREEARLRRNELLSRRASALRDAGRIR